MRTMPRTAHKKYAELETTRIPNDVPEAGIKEGATGTVVDVSPSGVLTVEVSDEQGVTLALLDISPEPEPHVIGRWYMGALEDPTA